MSFGNNWEKEHFIQQFIGIGWKMPWYSVLISFCYFNFMTMLTICPQKKNLMEKATQLRSNENLVKDIGKTKAALGKPK